MGSKTYPRPNRHAANLPAQRNWSHGALGSVVVDAGAAITQHQGESVPSREHIANGAGQLGLAGDPRQRLLQRGAQVGEQRCALCLANSQADLSGG